MSNARIELVGLDHLKRTFLKANWRGSKIRTKMRQAMTRGAKGARNEVRSKIRSTPGISKDAARRFARTYGFNKVGHGGARNFGVVLSPRLAGRPRRRGADILTRRTGEDMRYIINFHAKKLSIEGIAEQHRKNVEDQQWDFIETLWAKGQLK